MKDIEGLEDIKIFVDNFYQKVRDDDFIGPIFMKTIGDWTPHLEKMYAFWNAALFGVAGFKGNPFAKHAPLKINPNHFERWLQLFDKTIDDNFTGLMAQETKNRSRLMANMFIKRLSALNDDHSKVVY